MSTSARLCDAHALTADELDDICLIEQNCFGGESWSRDGLVRFLSGDVVSTAAVYADGNIVSFACSVAVCDEAEIVKVATSPDCRRHGYAKAAIEALFSAFVKNDIRRVLLEVRETNEGARALYGSLGFVEYSRRKNYYSSPREDAILMEKFI